MKDGNSFLLLFRDYLNDMWYWREGQAFACKNPQTQQVNFITYMLK